MVIVSSAVVNSGAKFNFCVGFGFKPYFYFPVTFLIFHFIPVHIHQSLGKEAVLVT
jgi:hypothetical protein